MRKPRKGIASGTGQRQYAEKANGRLPAARDLNASDLGHKTPATEDATRQVPDHSQTNAEELGHKGGADRAISELPTPPRFSADPRIQQIMALARERTYWMQLRLTNTARLAAEVRRHLQPTRGQEETWSDTVKTEALEIVNAAIGREVLAIKDAARAKPRTRKLKSEEYDHPLLHTGVVIGTAKALAQWKTSEEATLNAMEQITSTFPIAAFVNDSERKGFTLAGLAVIIGHAGHPLDYPEKGHLWKRLGLAPYGKNGTVRAGSTWGRCGGLDKNDWIELGYKRSRLGDLFGKITQPLLYAQWRSTGAIGPYGEAYGRYKARQKTLNESGAFVGEAARQALSARKAGKKPQKALLEGKLSDAQINARALRYMTKKLIADLWFAWRRLDQFSTGDKPTDMLSTAAESFEGKATKRLPSEARSVMPTPQSHMKAA